VGLGGSGASTTHRPTPWRPLERILDADFRL
jgi:hypothetical protein